MTLSMLADRLDVLRDAEAVELRRRLHAARLVVLEQLRRPVLDGDAGRVH